jgi:hypothetical protein
MNLLLERRELLIQRMQRLHVSDESYLKYVNTINDMFEILRRTIQPNSYVTRSRQYKKQTSSTDVQGRIDDWMSNDE